MRKYNLIKKYFSRSEKVTSKFIFVWIFFISVAYTLLSILHHEQYLSGGYDLGIYDQVVWLYSNLKIPFSTIENKLIIGDHAALTLPIISIFYKIWDDTRILLIFQSVWVALSAWPIYFIARKKINSLLPALIITTLYSTFWGFQYALFFDFHPIIIGVGLLSWMAYLLETEKYLWYWIIFIIAVITQENMGIAITSLSFFYVRNHKYRKQAVLSMILGLGSTFVMGKFTAHNSITGYSYWPEIPLNPLEIFKRYFDTSEKRLSLILAFSWFLWIPILSIETIVAIFFDLAQYFITGEKFSRTWSPYMHYRAILAPFLTLGTLQIYDKYPWMKRHAVKLSSAMLIVAIMLQFMFHFPLNLLSKKYYWQTEPWMNNINMIINDIPKNATVVTQQNIIPHISHREKIYLLWPKFRQVNNYCSSPCWWLDFNGKPDLLLVDTRPNQWLTQILESNENYQSAIENMEKNGIIHLLKSTGDARLYKIAY
jgi:uncharacterized membrane protein